MKDREEKGRRPVNRQLWLIWTLTALLGGLCLLRPEGSRAVAPFLLWAWSGGVTQESARIKAKLRDPRRAIQLVVTSDGTEPRILKPTESSFGVISFELDGLTAGQEYRYGFRSEGEDSTLQGRFQTFPEGQASFKFIFSACAQTGSNSPVFETILDQQPLFFLHLGDFHYEDIRVNRAQSYREAYDRVLLSPRQSRLFRNVPIVYIWDDHDFGPNNSDRESRGRNAAQQVYREVVPHYPLLTRRSNGAHYQAFTVGRVRFLVTDSRSDKSSRQQPDSTEKSLLGAEQKAWLKSELLAAKENQRLTVWANSVPWIARPSRTADHWGGYGTERQEIARFIVRHQIESLVMVSGDAHMLAIDDGRNNTYGNGRRGFPVFHAAALDRFGSVKGGPYSHGTSKGGGRFGVMQVEDRGASIRVRWSGRNRRNRELLKAEFEFPVAPGDGNE